MPVTARWVATVVAVALATSPGSVFFAPAAAAMPADVALQHYLKASNTGADDALGYSVAVAANSATESTVVVGADGEKSCATGVDGNQTNNACRIAGAVYVFSCSTSSGGTCTQLAYLKASNTGANDNFGLSVAVAANSATESTVVVGASGENSCARGVNGIQTSNACSNAGAGYVFSCSTSSGGTCTQLAYLKASNTGAFDAFGRSVAVAANSATESTVVVGAMLEDSCARGVNGSQTSNTCTDAGAGYVFSCGTSSGGTCTQLAYLKASNTGGVQDRFGWSVAVATNSATESTVVVGAYLEDSCATGVDGSDDEACTDAGSGYVFACSTSSGGTCMQLAYLKASNTYREDNFGYSVAVAANSATESTVVVGARNEDSCATGVDGSQSRTPLCSSAGSGYVFSCSTSSGGTCTQLAYLKASNTGGVGDYFGRSVAVAANSATESTVVVGAYGEDSCASGVNGSQTSNGCSDAGSGYMFSCNSASGGTCRQLAYLKASNTGASDRFGYSVAVAANSATESTVVVGAPYEDSFATGVDGGSGTDNNCNGAGSAYMFTSLLQMTTTGTTATTTGDPTTGITSTTEAIGTAGTAVTTGTSATTTTGITGNTGLISNRSVVEKDDNSAISQVSDMFVIYIAAAGAGCCICIVLLVAGAFFVGRRQRSSSDSSGSSYAPSALELGDLSQPTSGPYQRFDFGPSTGENTLKQSKLALDPASLTVDTSAPIGKGEYGIVFKGTYERRKVAVKNLLCNANDAAVREFVAEAELMARIPDHENVLQFIGLARAATGESAIVTELCIGSSLLNARRSAPLDEITTWFVTRGIAKGMAHLAASSICHRDLACRNVLLTEDWTPKVCDFGMSRLTWSVEANAESRTDSTIGPIKWMAPESLRERIYSQKTDVWMFACTIIEMISGQEPFFGLTAVQAGTQVSAGQSAPTIPPETPAAMVPVLQQALAFKASRRPDFREICRQLGGE